MTYNLCKYLKNNKMLCKRKKKSPKHTNNFVFFVQMLGKDMIQLIAICVINDLSHFNSYFKNIINKFRLSCVIELVSKYSFLLHQCRFYFYLISLESRNNNYYINNIYLLLHIHTPPNAHLIKNLIARNKFIKYTFGYQLLHTLAIPIVHQVPVGSHIQV